MADSNIQASLSEGVKLNARLSEGVQLNAGLSEGSSGTTNYNVLSNKPSIEGHTLVGDKTFKQLGMDTLAEWEIEKILYLD